MLDCVLFDLDGLLVDSEPLQFRAYQYAFTQFGITLTMDDWVRLCRVSSGPQTRVGISAHHGAASHLDAPYSSNSIRIARVAGCPVDGNIGVDGARAVHNK
jgi:beta-phosphoglucomutase-like phosphatase (HAD superfamily)